MAPVKIHSLSHLGLIRANNEDRFFMKEYGSESIFLVIADGMGGHAAGEKAAQIAVDTMAAFDPNRRRIGKHLVELVQLAEMNIRRHSEADASLRGMGTTLTACYLKKAAAFWVHVGDTRLYLFRQGALTRITNDHTIPGRLMKNGELDEEGARLHPLRNMLLRCVGCEDAEPDEGSFSVQQGDVIMLSSDGLHDAVTAERVASILDSGESLEEKMELLVKAALEAGGRDNITVVAAEL